MNNKITSFKDLIVWQTGIELVTETYKLTKKFPQDELYGLTSQMKRAAVSIPSNIAEGFKRYHNKEYRQFLRCTLGSSAELETQLIIAENLKYVNKEDAENLHDKLTQLSKMLYSLIDKLK